MVYRRTKKILIRSVSWKSDYAIMTEKKLLMKSSAENIQMKYTSHVCKTNAYNFCVLFLWHMRTETPGRPDG